AKKEHKQIVSVLKSIEALPPGLYGMNIITVESDAGEPHYEVEFVERRLEEVVANLNRFKRQDEKPFEAVAAVSEFNQRAYELFAQPMVQAMSNEFTAKLARDFHPLRAQRWAISDINPWLGWLAPAAAMVQSQRKALDRKHPWRRLEAMGSELINASLDYYRDVNNAISEASFFELYGNLFSLTMADNQGRLLAEQVVEPRQLPVVQAALAKIAKGGFAEAATRISFMLQRQGEPLPLSRIEMRAEVAKEYEELLPDMAPDALRRIRGEQEIIVRFEPEKALATLPQLLSDPQERQRLLKLLDAVLADKRIQKLEPTAEQKLALEHVRSVLGLTAKSLPKTAAKADAKARSVAKPAAKPASKSAAKPPAKAAGKPAVKKPVAKKPAAATKPASAKR
ncbi:MAG: hypothetical protein QG660_2122, partial [Pseudomonadota bacterium]|nr:hypothetical protein [Pseudomonadota bacterium]